MDPILIILIGTATVLFCIIRLKLHAAISLLLAALITALLTSPEQIALFADSQGMGENQANSLVNMSLGKRLATAFGNTSGKIGILIALASIIGTALMRSGGAERIIRSLLSLFGKKRTSIALLTGSFTLAIPVFFDTVFYLMIPLVKSIGVRNPKRFSLYLMISTLIVMYLLWVRLKNVETFKKFIFEALSSAGMIILITSCGGAFGQMLQQTGIGIRVGEMAANYQMAILPLAFFISAGVRTAQGSATVAMVTAIGVIGGMAQADLAFHPVYIALAIGCGSKVFAWMNDSAFWIITKMSGMEEKETIRHFSLLLLVMGFSGLLAVMVLSKLAPFV